MLEKLLARHLPDGVALMPMTTDLAAAQLWMVDHCAAGIEGVVAKRLDQDYRPGGRTWRKVRSRTTAEAVVGVLGPVVQPDALIVGCRDTSGRLRVSGRTPPLSPSARATMTHVLQPPGASHPWPRTIPSSRFGQLPSHPVTYTKVKPRVVVELDVDGSFEDYRWRHACRFVRVRRDVKAANLPHSPSSDEPDPAEPAGQRRRGQWWPPEGCRGGCSSWRPTAARCLVLAVHRGDGRCRVRVNRPGRSLVSCAGAVQVPRYALPWRRP